MQFSTNVWISGTNCQDFVTANAAGFYCTCNTSFCNDVASSNTMFTRAEAGITGNHREIIEIFISDLAFIYAGNTNFSHQP